MEKALQRGAAFVCRRGQKGVDLVVPIRTTNGVGGLLVQIKNWEDDFDSDYPASASSKLTPKYVGLDDVDIADCFCLYINLGGRLKRNIDLPQAPATRGCSAQKKPKGRVVIHLDSFAILNKFPDIKKQLSEIRCAYRNPFSFASSTEERMAIARMLPLQTSSDQSHA